MANRLVRKGLVSLLAAGAFLAGSFGLGGCVTTGRNYNHNASYWSPQNAAQRSADVNTVTLGVLGNPLPVEQLPGGSRTDFVGGFTGSGINQGSIATEIYCYMNGRDDNGNGFLDTSEMQGLGQRFWSDSPMIISASLSQQLPNIGMWITRLNGSNSLTVDYRGANNASHITANYPPNFLSPGEYRVLVGHDATLLKTADFVVFDRSVHSKK